MSQGYKRFVFLMSFWTIAVLAILSVQYILSNFLWRTSQQQNTPAAIISRISNDIFINATGLGHSDLRTDKIVEPRLQNQSKQVLNLILFSVFKSRGKVSKVNCKALIQGDKMEQTKALNDTDRQSPSSYQGKHYIRMTRNCDIFKSIRGYITSPLNAEEENFPIAFSILMFKDIEQAERLLRAIYRPQNVYCIHVDKKSPQDIHAGMDAVANCFDNVYIVKNPVAVWWGKFSVLEPELICMRSLWSYKKWKYFINLTGQEFPLKTNLELIKILKAYNGSNNLGGTRKRANVDRWANIENPPHGIKPTMGAVHITASRGFVDFILHNSKAQDFLQWVKLTKIPDETFFASLNYNPHLGAPGSYKGDPDTNLEGNPFLTRFKVWDTGKFNLSCEGKFVRLVCIFGVGDLPVLTSQPHLFANKFHWDFQHFTRECLEEWHFNKTRDEFYNKRAFDVSMYRKLDFVVNSVH